MIKSITMKNIGSYKETKLETDKRINLIFGFNGTGKTLFANRLHNLIFLIENHPSVSFLNFHYFTSCPL